MYGLEGVLGSNSRFGFGSIEDGRPGVKVLVVVRRYKKLGQAGTS
jgi:hypothetical protein